MATPTKLEQAVESQAKNLDPAQYELVMSQFKTYKWNKARMSEIEVRVKMLELHPSDDSKTRKIDLAERKQLMAERHQLTVDCNSIATKLFMQLKNTATEVDEFDEFLGKES